LFKTSNYVSANPAIWPRIWLKPDLQKNSQVLDWLEPKAEIWYIPSIYTVLNNIGIKFYFIILNYLTKNLIYIKYEYNNLI